MPRRKPKPEKVIEEKIKQSLDSILIDESLEHTIPGDFDGLPRIKKSNFMDFDAEKLSAITNAKSLLKSISKFHIEPGKLGVHEHINEKGKMDAMNLSSMVFQLKTGQHAIIKLLEEIEMGNNNPKLLEVLTQLQNQIMKIPKEYQDYIDRMENNFRKSKIDIENKIASGSISIDGEEVTNSDDVKSIDSNVKSRGTKGIMEGLRDILGSEIVDVIAEIIPDKAVVNARDKKIIDRDNPNLINLDRISDNEGFFVEDDLLDN